MIIMERGFILEKNGQYYKLVFNFFKIYATFILLYAKICY